MPVYSELGKVFKKKHISINQFSKDIEISRPTLTKIVNSDVVPSETRIDSLERIAKGLNVPFDSLFSVSKKSEFDILQQFMKLVGQQTLMITLGESPSTVLRLFTTQLFDDDLVSDLPTKNFSIKDLNKLVAESFAKNNTADFANMVMNIVNDKYPKVTGSHFSSEDSQKLINTLKNSNSDYFTVKDSETIEPTDTQTAKDILIDFRIGLGDIIHKNDEE